MVKKSKLFAAYLLILRCLVAIFEQLEVQVLVLLKKILKLILLGKRRKKKTVFRTPVSHHDLTIVQHSNTFCQR